MSINNNNNDSPNGGVKIWQQCTNAECTAKYGIDRIIGKCEQCGSGLEYTFEGQWDGVPSDRDDLWKNFPMIPLQNEENIVALGAGGSELLLLEELSGELNGANFYLKLDCFKNPTGTFKDREASIIMSRVKELGLDNLVFYSTGNTGRAYTHFAAHLNLNSYFFMPRQCQYKNTTFIKKNPGNRIILVDDHYPKISPYAKKFAQENGLTTIAPLHDRNESYATVAYEQRQQLPECHYFAQTIASGMGPIGFYKGHMNMVQLGLETKEDIPTLIGIQSSQVNVMARAYNSGRTTLTPDDMPPDFPEDLFEPTLNSTNPVNNYPQLHQCLQENNGIITDVEPEFTGEKAQALVAALEKRGITLRTDVERSLLIGYSGLVKLAGEGKFQKGENIMLLAVGRGKDDCTELIEPDAVINPQNQDPVELFKKLN